jgi:serine/threonine-protein kinase
MSVPERLSAALSDRYRIERELGQGGMATVYLAEDLKHDRKVAVKVLKPELAAVVGGDRFVTEIRTTANLQHPHILPLFDSGEADSFLFYVMPYVEGEALRDKLDREKQLSVPEAIAITVKIAGALQSAHDQGVIHRDIKPANVLLQNGEPVVADFGIALAVQQAGEGRITETGLSLGTPYYMAPEQATADRDPDARSDLYSLACMLYEMLTGEPPFHGTTAQAVLGRILTQPPPDVTQARPSVPPHIGAILTRALQKLPADRFESVAEFSRALQNEGYVDPAARASWAWAAAQGGGPAWKRLLPWGVSAVAVAAAVAVALGSGSAGPEDRAVQRYLYGMQPGQEFTAGPIWADAFALTPDGQEVIYRGADQGEVAGSLWRRNRASLAAVPIPGTEGAFNPRVSRDGRNLAFASFRSGDFAIGVVPLEGGTPLWLEATGSRFAWGDDGAIYFVDEDANTIVRWEPGTVTPIPVLPNGSVPRMDVTDVLPGSRAALLRADSGIGYTTASIVSFDSGDVRDLELGRVSRARYSPTGHLVALREDGALIAVPLDPRTLEFTGPVRATGETVSQLEYAFSASGTLVYLTAPEDALDQPLVWVSEDGSEETIDWIDPGYHDAVSISPDGTKIAAGVAGTGVNGGGSDVWIYDLEARTQLALTRDGDSQRPVWHPDGERITYVKVSGGFAMQPADRSGQEEVLLDLPPGIKDGVWTPDGEEFVVRRQGEGSGRGIYRLVPGAESDSVLLERTFDDTNPRPSPDGRWLVFTTTESGTSEILATRYPGGGGFVPVSTRGGAQPVWAKDGSNRLFFVDGEGMMQAVQVAYDDTSFRVLATEPLFNVRERGFPMDEARARYDVSEDGRFLMIRGGESEDASLVMVENWDLLLGGEGAGR